MSVELRRGALADAPSSDRSARAAQRIEPLSLPDPLEPFIPLDELLEELDPFMPPLDELLPDELEPLIPLDGELPGFFAMRELS